MLLSTFHSIIRIFFACEAISISRLLSVILSSSYLNRDCICKTWIYSTLCWILTFPVSFTPCSVSLINCIYTTLGLKYLFVWYNLTFFAFPCFFFFLVFCFIMLVYCSFQVTAHLENQFLATEIEYNFIKSLREIMNLPCSIYKNCCEKVSALTSVMILPASH